MQVLGKEINPNSRIKKVRVVFIGSKGRSQVNRTFHVDPFGLDTGT